MRDSFNNRPKLVKGSIVGLDPYNPLASIIVFQYNPVSLTRTFTPRVTEESGQIVMKTAPKEDISLEIQINGYDQVEESDSGIHPQLAALEMLLYQKSAKIAADFIQNKLGVYEIMPPKEKEMLTLFTWGDNRLVPIRITSFSIEEEAYDHLLNPIRAKVSLGFKCLNYSDFEMGSIGYFASVALHVIKEVRAVQGSVPHIAHAITNF